MQIEINIVLLRIYTGKSWYLELGYVEYPGCVEPSARSQQYLLYNMIFKKKPDISNTDISISRTII
jgi:hypothetical protein